MTRIIAGTASGRRLVVPSGARPTTDRVRESLFAALDHRLGGFEGLAVLDLYAGSGALGLEAASRGAARVVLVDSSPLAVRAIRTNSTAVGVAGVEVVRRPVAAFLASAPAPFDLVLADPPYEVPETALGQVLGALARGWLARHGLVVVERPSGVALTWPSGIEQVSHRTYGSTSLWYGQRVLEADDL